MLEFPVTGGDSCSRPHRPRDAIFIPSQPLIHRAPRGGPDRLTRSSGGVCPERRSTVGRASSDALERFHVGSVIKKRRKRMAKKKHRKLLKKTRVQRRKLGK